ncbi:alkaline phosphatase family protein [bacterium]|nr:alkaline phosphatase family protein [bacterium]
MNSKKATLLSILKATVFLCLGMVLLFMCHCTDDRQQNQEKNKKVILFGIDGVEWHILHPLMKMGRVPVIQKLMCSGSIANLFSPSMCSPVEWTTIVTGKSKEKHGVLGFPQVQQRAPGQQKKEDNPLDMSMNITRQTRKSMTLWNIFSNHHHGVASIGWWATWPAEEINGTLISDTFLYNRIMPHTFSPPSIEQSLKEIEQMAKIRGESWLKNYLPAISTTHLKNHGNDYRVISGQLEKFSEHLTFDFVKQNIALYLIEKENPDLVFLYLRASDLSSHFFYRDTFHYSDNTDWPESGFYPEKFHWVIPATYELYDLFLDELLVNYDQMPYTIIVSDHGFGFQKMNKRVEFGKFFRNSKLLVNDQDPISFVKWKNKKDQEGTVQFFIDAPPQIEPNSSLLLQELRTTLAAIQNISGENLFESLNIVADGPDSQSECLEVTVNPAIQLADIIVFPKTMLPAHELFFYSQWSGSHRRNGIAIFNGPCFKKGHLVTTNIKTWDICPTILSIYSLPRGQDMDGHLITDIFTPRFLQNNPRPADISTYDRDLKDESFEKLDPEAEHKLINELKTIGYLN